MDQAANNQFRRPVSCHAELAGREIHYLAWGNPDNPPLIM